ncbi:unnamed protein product [Oppiella nova]|uniref:Partial AB-hydrolase lipase domain-containing protein n=1 Tax=Oppiella nova TaxID=334625 RepID=A0A7R9M4D2_9ACAR|nr:unnamed protein product [Oppiella nova]CAG2170441.1 unnamed protein product [Oppiella nova]
MAIRPRPTEKTPILSLPLQAKLWRILSHAQTGVKVNNILAGLGSGVASHSLQIIEANSPQRYDYGDDIMNLQKYGSVTPPCYDISAITSTNIAFIYAASDWIVPVPDVRNIIHHLKVPLLDDYLVPDHTWNHMDLLWAREAGRYVNTRAQIIESRGFRAENHYITTGDGYILSFTRIVNPHVTDRSKLRPIILQHGFQANADMWLINSMGRLTDKGQWVEDNNNGPVGNTLGFVLAVNGYDVWLANMRGNIYSQNHTKFKIDDPRFWRFSVDEMIDYDLPAMISYIQKETQKASQPQYSNIIEPAILIATVPFLGNTTTPNSDTPFLLVPKFRKSLGHLCDSSFISRYICYTFIKLTLGFQQDQWDFTRTGVYISTMISGSSSRNVEHIHQIINAIRFQRYDYGDNETNTQKYQSQVPPPYDMSAINSTNIALIYTANDWMITLPDLQKLKGHLKDDYMVPELTWNHNEPLLGREAGLN